MKNFLGHDVVWRWEMNKINPPLAVSLQESAMRASAAFFEYPIGAQSYWYDNGDIYFDAEEVQTVEKFIAYAIAANPEYPDQIARKIYALSDVLRIPLDIGDCVDLETSVRRFRRVLEPVVSMMSALAERGPMPMANVLRQRVEEIVYTRTAANGTISSAETDIQALSLAIRPSVFAEERKDFFRVAAEIVALKAEERTSRVDEYVSRFGWMTYHWAVGVPRSVDDVLAEMSTVQANAEVEYGRLMDAETADESVCAATAERLGLSAREREIVRQYREYLYLRTFVKDSINIGFFHLLPLFRKIAEYTGVQPEYLPFLTAGEFDSLVTTSVSEIEERVRVRKESFSAGIAEGVFVIRVFDYQDPDRIQKSDEGTIRGNVAFRGNVRGTVRILRSPAEQEHVRPGDVLVVGMTTPDYLPAMNRAAAFVTDEGGITCHAAIVAREMKKPCIIGTKIGTRVLKDGDMVEVDAEKGIVRIIERAVE